LPFHIDILALSIYALSYVYDEFVQHQGAEIYYIPWPAKKIADQNFHTSLSGKSSRKWYSLNSQQAKAAKNELKFFLIIIK
jgi:hypothetical protein